MKHIAIVSHVDESTENEPAEDSAARRWRVQPETAQLRRLQTAMVEAELALARGLKVNPTDLAAMGHLAGAEEPVGPTWLSGRLGLTPAAATELVDRLERAGHVERRRDVVDRRRVQLVPTASALSDVGGRLAPLLAALDLITASYTAEQRRTILGYLEEIVTAYAEFARRADDPSAPPATLDLFAPEADATRPGGAL